MLIVLKSLLPMKVGGGYQNREAFEPTSRSNERVPIVSTAATPRGDGRVQVAQHLFQALPAADLHHGLNVDAAVEHPCRARVPQHVERHAGALSRAGQSRKRAGRRRSRVDTGTFTIPLSVSNLM